MTKIVFIIIVAAGLFGGCRKTEHHAASRVWVDKIAGQKVWHGTYSFGGVTHTLTNDTVTISAINDSQVVASNWPSTVLTYAHIDSSSKYVLFSYAWGPPRIFYFYETGAIHYSLNLGGLHNEDTELYYP